MEIKNLKFKIKIYHILFFTVFAIGIYLRLKFYITNYPLWHDECSLALSIINKSIFDYFGLLEHNQSAPPLFLVISKIFTLVFGEKEYALRLFPFLCGIFSIPVFYYFSKLFINKKWVLLLANFLFAINFHLIHYSIEFKQYSLDVFLFMLTFLLCIRLNIYKLCYKKALMLGVIFALLPILSLPTGFVIIGIMLLQLIKYKKAAIKNILIISVPIILIGILYLILTLIPQQASKFLFDGTYWDSGFISLNIIKIYNLLKTNFPYYLYPNKFILFELFLSVIGFYYLINNISNKNNCFLLICIIEILLASFLKIYPIYQRVSLYLIPTLLLVIVLPANYIQVRRKIYSGFIILFLVFGLCGYNLVYAKSFLNKDLYQRNDSRTAMRILKEKYKNSDNYILVNAASDSEFKFYKKYFDFDPNPYRVIYVQTPTYSQSKYQSILESLPNNNEYWFYYAYDYYHSPVIPFLIEWSKNYKVLYEAHANGAYILNLRK